MPWRLIIAIVVFAILLVFVTFNLDNRCDISFGFGKVPNVPVFITVFFSFIFGLFCALPFALLKRKKYREKQVKEKKPKKTIFSDDKNSSPSDGGQDAAD